MTETSATALEWVRPLQQNRAERTAARLMDAAEELLEDMRFEQMSIAAVTQRAGCSVGAFYGRFADKEALLQCLDERYCREMIATIERLGDAHRWRGQPIAVVVEQVVAFLVRVHKQRRGLFRTLILAARIRDDERFHERTARMNRTGDALVAVLLERADEIRHPHPEQAIRFGLLMVLTTMREVLLFQQGPAGLAAGAERGLARRLAEAWLDILRVER